jgi:hypothetical protein
MSQKNYTDELARLSLSLLHLIREIGKNDPAEAAACFGVTDEVVRLIVDSSNADLRAVASTGVMLFAPRIKSSHIATLLATGVDDLQHARTLAMALATPMGVESWIEK